ncbi:MAG: SPFH domain-containing protein, partial [Massilia sp.]
MSLGSFIKKQFIDVLQWNEETEGVLAWRYPMQDFEIQNGAILNVRESQVAVFVNEGVIADVFGPGTHKLTTQTLPLLTNLKNWDKLFDSPFKSDVYYFSTRVQTGRKWGTPQPITIRDKDFDMIRVRAFGMFSYRVADARKFFTEISGTREIYTRDEVEEQLRGLLMATMASSLGGANVAFLDMAANQALMAQQVKGDLATAFARYGIGLDEFNVASVSLPEELQAALDERISAGMKGGLSSDKMSG